MATLAANIAQAIRDYDDIQSAIIEKGVEVPTGTPTSEYGAKVRQIIAGGGGDLPPGWNEAQVGEALENIEQYGPILWQQLGTSNVPFYGVQQLDTSGGAVNGIALSTNGARMISIRQSGSPVRIYNRDASRRYALASVQPTYFTTVCSSCAISPDGDMIFVTRSSPSPYLVVMRWDGAQWLHVTLDVDTGAGVQGCELSPDGKMLAVGYDRSPWITFYKVGPTTLTRLAGPDTMPAYPIYTMAFSPSGSYFFTAINTTGNTNCYMYSIAGDVITNIPTASLTVNPAMRRATWSPDEQYLATAIGASVSATPIILFRFAGNVLTRQTDVSFSGSVSNNGMAWVGNRIFLANSGTGLMHASHIGGVLKYLDDPVPIFPGIVTTGGGQRVIRSSDGSVVIWGNNSLVVFDTIPVTVVKPISNAKNIQYGDLGFATEAATKGQPCNVNVFPALRG